MHSVRTLASVIVMFGIALIAHPASAAFHLWTFSEVYSNSDGSVQFIELFTASPSQTFTNGTQIKSNTKTFTFPSSLSGDSTNKHMLLATAGFGALMGGVTPDFTIPSNFFNTAGDHLVYVSILNNSATFATTPTNGVSSLNFPGGTTATNSPTNYAGATGSVNLPPPVVPTGDYNGNGVVDAADYTVWRDTLGQSVATKGTLADGNADGTINTGDYTFWASKFGTVLAGAGAGASQAGAVPEPSTLLLLLGSFLMFCVRCRARAS